MAGGIAAIAVLLVTDMAMIWAQVPALGPCPEIETMQGFNMQRVSMKPYIYVMSIFAILILFILELCIIYKN
jgi:hypothetical protein